MTLKTKKILKIAGKSALGVVLALLVIVCGYAVYFVSAFNRIGDIHLEVSKGETTTAGVATNQTYNLLSWNIGFCAYSDDYSFFMDGGTESRAFSKDAVDKEFESTKGGNNGSESSEWLELIAKRPNWLILLS